MQLKSCKPAPRDAEKHLTCRADALGTISSGVMGTFAGSLIENAVQTTVAKTVAAASGAGITAVLIATYNLTQGAAKGMKGVGVGVGSLLVGSITGAAIEYFAGAAIDSAMGPGFGTVFRQGTASLATSTITLFGSRALVACSPGIRVGTPSDEQPGCCEEPGCFDNRGYSTIPERPQQ